MFTRSPIFVETMISTPMGELWEATQDPLLHQRWDLRFSNITYLPKEAPDDDQRFLYETRIGFGLSISGDGISRGHIEKQDGSRVSSLVFSSPQSFSLICKGSGYWEYISEDRHIRFLTQYDYKTRWGAFGSFFDRLFFRPLIGWATAWSFDTLRLWLEKGISPETSLRRSIIHVLLCLTMAMIWIHQGLIPKILFPKTGEKQLMKASGLFPGVESEMAV